METTCNLINSRHNKFGMSKEDRRRRLMGRKLNQPTCPFFIKGETFNEIGGDCSMSTTFVSTGEQLLVRGASDSMRSILDRAGVAPNPPAYSGGSKAANRGATITSVYDRHFVLTGTAKIILINLELKGAWVGDTEAHNRNWECQ